MMTDFWEARPVLRHIRDYARASGAGPVAVLAGVIGNAIASTDPDLQLPDGGSLNLCIAFVGQSGAGKGRGERAAQHAVRFPRGGNVERWSIGSGEGLAALFATDKDGNQACRSAVIDVHEVDGLAALAKRQGSTIMSTIRQVWSGEPIGQLNAATRRYAPAHSYRAIISVGVQPERAEALLGDRAGTAQRTLWVPVSDPDAPRARPQLPDPISVNVDGVGGTIEIPDIARDALAEHRWHVLTDSGEVDPLDGHAMFTRLKVAAGFMLLDERTDAISDEDWELAGALVNRSTRTREQIQTVMSDAARRSNRAKAHAVAERDEVVSERKLERAKAGVLRWLERDGELPRNELRSRARSDWRDQVSAALADLVADGTVTEIQVDRGARYRLTGRSTLDRGSTHENRSSEGVDPASTLDPIAAKSPGETIPGDTTDNTPGLTPRVLAILDKGN